jgi:hypothetical protein
MRQLEKVLGTIDGRAVIWELLSRAGIFNSIWESSARIHYNAGRQDFGHELLALVTACNEELYVQLEREARAQVKRDNQEIDAGQTARISEGSSDVTS